MFLQKHADDPAIKVVDVVSSQIFCLYHMLQDFVPKLKDHLLPRIRDLLGSELSTNSDRRPLTPNDHDGWHDRDYTLFKNDQIYQHRITRFNYTTYDVRRAQVVINPNTL